MPITLDAPPAQDVRRPNDFKRKGPDGPPYVKSLTKTKQRTGRKAELLAECEARGIEVPPKATVAVLKELLGPEPAWELYGRPSGFGELIDNAYALIKWKERQVALGIAMQPDVLRELDGVEGDDEERAALDRIANTAHDVAGSDIAADRGTWVHALTEVGRGGVGVIPSHLLPEECFEVTADQALAIARGWVELLADNGLTVLASEQAVVNDELRLAGTLDRVVQLERDLHFGDATVPAGSVVVLDIKTSKLHADDDGLPGYWSQYPIQIAAYAGSAPYVFDGDDEFRAEWSEVLT